MDGTRVNKPIVEWVRVVGAWACILPVAGCGWTQAGQGPFLLEPCFVAGESIQVHVRADLWAKMSGKSPEGRVSQRRELQHHERYQDQIVALQDDRPATVIRHWTLAERITKNEQQVSMDRLPQNGLTVKGLWNPGAGAYDLYRVTPGGPDAKWEPTDAELAQKVRQRLYDDLDLRYFVPSEPVEVGQAWEARAPVFMTKEKVPVPSGSGTLREYVRPFCRLQRADGMLLTLVMRADGQVPVSRSPNSRVWYTLEATIHYDACAQKVMEFSGTMRIWVRSAGEIRGRPSTLEGESSAKYHIQYRYSRMPASRTTGR